MTSTIEQSQTQQQNGIDRDKETLIAICDVRKHVLETSGRKLGLPTLYRWFQVGVSGVKLEVIFIMNRAHTSLEALRRFDDRVTAAKLAGIDKMSVVKVATQRQVEKAQKAAKAKLAGGAK